MLKGSKIKVMKVSKNRRELTQVKAIFLHINKQEILIYHDYKEIHTKNIVSGCVARSKHRIDILTAKSIEKEYLNVSITEPFLFGIH